MRRDPTDTSYQTLWHYHLTFPLANLILLLVGIPLMFNYERGKERADRDRRASVRLLLRR